MDPEETTPESPKRGPFLVILAGYVALVVGIGFVFWPAALIVGGVLLMAAGFDLTR